jgi:hypothetical protein
MREAQQTAKHINTKSHPVKTLPKALRILILIYTNSVFYIENKKPGNGFLCSHPNPNSNLFIYL